MISLFKLLSFPLFSLTIFILGTGFFSTFVSVRLDLAETSSEMIGLITASFYAGILLSSLLAPSWIARWGHRRIWTILLAANSILTLSHALWVDALFWVFLRFLSGVIMGGVFVVIESWILLLSPSAKRSLSLSLYILMYYIATSLGQLFLTFCDPISLLPYCLTAGLSALAIIPCSIRSLPTPAYTDAEGFSLLGNLRTSFKGFFGGFISGMLLACIYGLAPIFGQKTGLTLSEIGTMMAVIVFGGLSLQLPLGKLADRYSRLWVMIFTCFASALFSILIAFCSDISWALQLSFLWLFGGFSFALYPLSMSFTCEKIPDSQIVSVAGGFNLVYGLGAVAGPLLSPLFMSYLGPHGLFYFIALICLSVCFVGSLPQRKEAYDS